MTAIQFSSSLMMGYYTWIHRTSMLEASVIYLVPISFRRFII